MQALKFHKSKIVSLLFLLSNNTIIGFIVHKMIMPILSRLRWHALNNGTSEKSSLVNLIKEQEDRRFAETQKYRYDIISSFLLLRIKPYEYFMYGFQNLTWRERLTYLSDYELDLVCAAKMTWETFSKLRDKCKFYSFAKQFFKRDVCCIRETSDFDQFEYFVKNHRKFFLKDNGAAFGRGCSIEEPSGDLRAYFDKLIATGSYIAEELIVQDAAMARWNSSSVNTIRLCSFRNNNDVSIAYPFIRVGRKGSIVDNGGQGGIFASIDIQTGVICTDGGDEIGNVYPLHPDSSVPFKGVQIPQWKELLDMCREVHASLPSEFYYVGFDFALTAKGWMLIEGNWGQFVAQQTTLHRGLRKEFEDLMGVRVVC